MFTDKQPVLLLNQRQNASSKVNSNALYTSYNSGSPQSAGQNLRNGSANVNASHNSIVPGLLQDRPHIKNGFIDGARVLERQMTLPERNLSNERVFQNNNGNVENRPQTQGYGFSNERLLGSDRNLSSLKQQLSPIFQDDPNQIIPQVINS